MLMSPYSDSLVPGVLYIACQCQYLIGIILLPVGAGEVTVQDSSLEQWITALQKHVFNCASLRSRKVLGGREVVAR